MPTTYEAIATVTVGSGGAANIEFTSIPATFTDLLLKYSLRSDQSGYRDILVSINSSTANFSGIALDGSGSAASSYTVARYLGTVGGTNITASTFTNGEVYIPNYLGSNNKSFSVDNVQETNATTAYSTLYAGLWSNTAAITGISIISSSGNLVQYSTATLYGIKNS